MDEIKKNKKTYTPNQARLKAESYCAYQERAQQEVRNKLYEWGLHFEDVEQIISQLIADNFLNEERFAVSFAQGRFRIKGWGKIKIKHQLQQKQISPPLIKIALASIDPDEYIDKLEEAISKKTKEPIEKLSANEKSKLIRHLQSKGFENDLIFGRVMN